MITTKLEQHPKIHMAVTCAFAVAAAVFFTLWLLQSASLKAQKNADTCWSVLRALGPSFSDVRPGVDNRPRCVVYGTVRAEADAKLLETRLNEAFTSREREKVSILVRVEATTGPASN